MLSSVSEFPFILSHSRLSRPTNAPGLKQKVSKDFFIGFCLTEPEDFGKEVFFIDQGLLYFWSVYVFFVLSNISKIDTIDKLFGDSARQCCLHFASNECSQDYLETECTFALCRGCKF